MNKEQIAAKIKETEEKLANLRKELEKPEYPTLANSKPGDMLENGCIVIHKFSDVQMALIAAPQNTEILCQWSKDFNSVFGKLEEQSFNISEWFIPNVEQLKMAYKNCKEHFRGYYWASVEHCEGITAHEVSFSSGRSGYCHKSNDNYVRAFSLVSY